MPDLSTLVREHADSRNRPETAVEGVFARDVVAATDLARVIVPDFHRHQDFECPWMPRVTADGVFFPHEGENCLVVFAPGGDSFVAIWETDRTTPDASIGTGAYTKGFVRHGSDAAAPRPSGYASIEWLGSVEPDNAIDGDTLILVP